MSAHGHSPFDDLREQFRAAAAREQAKSSRRRWFTRRAPVTLAFGALALSGGAAVATQLIATGEPKPEVAAKSDRFRPATAGTIAVTAADPDQPLPWGVLVYQTAAGEDCAIVGQVRGAQLGIIDGKVFRPFEDRTSGSCRSVDRLPFQFDIRYLAGRSLVFGRARADVATMEAVHRGRRQRAETGAAGAYLFVFDAGLKPSEFKLRALRADGKPAG